MGGTASSDTAPAISGRRYDIDALRVIAIMLLIVYHIFIAFQGYAASLLFIGNDETLNWLQLPMSLLNVWRLPLLFLVSGMGVRFAMERRDWTAMLIDRSKRILLPCLFGMFTVVPVANLLFQKFHGLDLDYWAGLGHLWFLANIYIYVVVLLPVLFWLKRHAAGRVFSALKKLLRLPGGLYVFILPLAVSAVATHPEYFSLYVGTLHGFVYGLLCFVTGFLLVSCSPDFWTAIERSRLVSLIAALILAVCRLVWYSSSVQDWALVLTALESGLWMFAALGYAARYFNRPSPVLQYLSKAVYPVYVIHLIVQQALALLIFPLALPAIVKLLLLLPGALLVDWLLYEVLRRIPGLRMLFGIFIARKKADRNT